MTGTPNDDVFQKLIARLRAARRVAIFTHQRPDADAMGSQAALALALGRQGANGVMMNYEPVPALYRFLQEGPGLRAAVFDAAWAEGEGATVDTIVVVDTAAYQQLEPAKDYLQKHHAKVVAIDHHLTRDPIGPVVYADTSAAACVEIVARVIDALGVPLDATIGLPLFAGLVADTGWFKFDNVTPATHRLAAALMEAGVKPAALYGQLMQNETAPKLALMQRALASVTYAANGAFVMMSLTNQDFADSGATPSQTEAIIDLPLQVGSVQVAAVLTETPAGVIRVSLRSKNRVDVAAICKQFGGGGHAKAAGCRIPGPLEAAKAALTAAVLPRLERI